MKIDIFSTIRRKVGIKFSFIVALVTIIILLTFSYFEIISSRNEAEKVLDNKIITLSDISSKAFSETLWNYDNKGTIAIAEGLFTDRDIYSIEIRDNFDKVIYSKYNSGPAYNARYAIQKDIAISRSQEVVGQIRINFTNYYVNEKIKTQTKAKVAEITFVTLILIFVISMATFIITKPIKKLSLGADEIAAGNLMKQIDVKSQDEIGELADKFNHMSRTLYNMVRERDETASALIASEEKFSKAFQASADIIGIVRLSDKHYIDVSDSFFEIFGYDRDEVIGHSSDEFGLWCHEEDRRSIYKVIDREGYHPKTEIAWRTKSGQIRVGISSTRLIEIGGEMCNLYVWHDITERKSAEEALQQAYDQLEVKVEERTQELIAMNQELRVINEELFETLDTLQKTQNQLVQSEKMAALGTLVAGVAHEINTPIGISMTASSYLEDLENEFEKQYQSGSIKRQDLERYLTKSRETVAMISNNLERAAKLVRSFKQVSVDQSTEERRIFKVKQYLEELLLSLHPKLKKTNQIVKISCEDQLEIDSYPGALAQIVTNLIMNSLIHAYTPDDIGQIDIDVAKAGDTLHINYSDDGKGMGKEVKDKIFEPFFTTKRGEGGTGLGLHIIYNIVTLQFGGTIECQSEPEKGTKFIIAIPMK